MINLIIGMPHEMAMGASPMLMPIIHVDICFYMNENEIVWIFMNSDQFL
jgi:hypothetical protein